MNIEELLPLAVAGAFYPALLAAVIVMLGRPHPLRLLAFFLAGAMLMSVSIGLAAVFLLDPANFNERTRQVNGPLYLTVGLVALAGAAELLGRPQGHDGQPRNDKGPSLSQRVLSRDSAKRAFALGIVLDLPGVWYVVALKHIASGDYTTAEMVLIVVIFNLILFIFVEVPLVAYAVAPEATRTHVQRFNGWLHRNGRRAWGYLALAAGVYLVAAGTVAMT